MKICPEKLDLCKDLTDTEIMNYCEGHFGVIMGLLTVLFDSTMCPELILEKEDNLIGGYFKLRENGDYEFVFDNFEVTENLFYNFDPRKLTCKRMMNQIQFMCKLMSQLRFLMDLAEINVSIYVDFIVYEKVGIL